MWVKICRRAFPLGNLSATPRDEQMFARSFVPMLADWIFFFTIAFYYNAVDKNE